MLRDCATCCSFTGAAFAIFSPNALAGRAWPASLRSGTSIPAHRVCSDYPILWLFHSLALSPGSELTRDGPKGRWPSPHFGRQTSRERERSSGNIYINNPAPLTPPHPTSPFPPSSTPPPSPPSFPAATSKGQRGQSRNGLEENLPVNVIGF